MHWGGERGAEWKVRVLMVVRDLEEASRGLPPPWWVWMSPRGITVATPQSESLSCSRWGTSSTPAPEPCIVFPVQQRYSPTQA